MKRRTFLTETAETILPLDNVKSRTPAVSEFANKTVPVVARTFAGLEPYIGLWGFDQIAHLLRRTMFGATRSDINGLLSSSLDQVVSALLADTPPPSPPLNVNSLDTEAPVGSTWVNNHKVDPNNPAYNPNSSRVTSLKSWWMGLMLNQSISIREKMTLFLHNHFVSDTADVGDARYSYKQNALLRQYSLGNFKELTKQITLDPAMLRYLNGNTNTKNSPNENYGRELQELFTIGKGPEIAPGNYTNYTEADVQAAARVLTGWRDDGSGTVVSSYFTLNRHDTTNKQFSSDYGNTVIAGSSDPSGMAEIDALLNMIFLQQETAKNICRELYRWFVYYVIDDVTEANVIVPLATILRNNNYEIKPVLQTLLKSAHFFDPVNVGCIIKNPADTVGGMCRQFGIVFPDASQLTKQYTMWKYARTQAANMQMDIGDPPNVAGWPAYYQTPQFYELWINSDTLPKRNAFTDALIGNGYTSGGYTLIADPINFAQQVSSPADANTLIAETVRILFPIAITDNQKAFLKDTLLPGLGNMQDYEWMIEWTDYILDPTNVQKKNAIRTRLQALFMTMMDMAEYQLM